jgi:hypothetical protein
VLRQLKRAAGDDVTAADFAADEADQLRLWTESQVQQPYPGAGRHRSTRGLLRRKRRGQHLG